MALKGPGRRQLLFAYVGVTVTPRIMQQQSVALLARGPIFSLLPHRKGTREVRSLADSGGIFCGVAGSAYAGNTDHHHLGALYIMGRAVGTAAEVGSQDHCCRVTMQEGNT